jgi:hypothetical protein
LSGAVVGCRRDTKELFLVRVDDNDVVEEVLRPADPGYLDYPPLAYEEAIDRDRELIGRRRRRPRSDVVVDLANRR